MENYNVVLFGEAEKGEYQTAYFCQTLTDLVEHFGNPPSNSMGLFFAVQALLYKRSLVFFRVKEEGFSHPDYLSGINVLQNQKIISDIAAICLPGVGDSIIIHAVTPVCDRFHSILVTTEADFYDYISGMTI